MSRSDELERQIRELSRKLASLNEHLFKVEHILKNSEVDGDEAIEIVETLATLREAKGMVRTEILQYAILYAEAFLATIREEFEAESKDEALFDENVRAYAVFEAAQDFNQLSIDLLDLIVSDDDEHPEP